MTKPFIKWAGGKRKLIPQISELLPRSYNAYHEPFLGGGALFFALQPKPKQAYLCDINKHLIDTYLGVRNNINDVINKLSKNPPYSNTRSAYNAIRYQYSKHNHTSVNAVAADFIYLNKIGYNGLYRENSSGGFNVPFGRYENPTICDEETLRNASKELRGANIINASFIESSKFVMSGDLWYADPPYIPISTTSNFTTYSKDGFGPAQQIQLRDIAIELKNKGVHVILSNSSSKMTYELYSERFTIKEVMVKRAINSNPSKREAIKELLIY
jgi:DNA adenine methylase